MVKILFTLDYEIHGNGEGCPYQLMVEPTARLLRLFDLYGAKLTIMADVAEILKFREYADSHPKDDYHYHDIVTQLQTAVRTGHDVQLHIHSSYFNASHDGRRWVQDWSEYNFAGLSLQRMDRLIGTGKEFLESLLRSVSPNYRCRAFRAANWSVSPSQNVVRSLLRNGIRIDSSVFKYGWREGLVNFDYNSAHSEMLPWRADAGAIWRSDPNSDLWEVPIYSENRYLGAFFSLNRVYRSALGRLHRVPRTLHNASRNGATPGYNQSPPAARLRRLMAKHAWKADFNQCTGRQLISALERGVNRHRDCKQTLPFVLIGHSKLFTTWNERTLRPFLAYIARNHSGSGFGTFDSLDLEASA